MVPRKDGETDEEYEDRREKLLNSIIADICIDLRHTELGDPTKELKALLGYQHLVDFKTLLPGQRYRADTDGTTGSPELRPKPRAGRRGLRQRRGGTRFAPPGHVHERGAQPPLWATTHAGGVRDTPPDHTQLPGRLCEPAP